MNDNDSETPIQLRLIAEITTVLATEGISHWLYGGWGIDFLIGEITRSHSDIDFVVWEADAHRVRALLEVQGYEWRPTRYPEERSVFSKQNQRIDVDFIERATTGQIVTPGRWKDWPWPHDAFTTRPACLQSIICPVVSAAAQLDSKESFQHYAAGTPPRAVDQADVAKLRASLAAESASTELPQE